ncbi:MAG: metallophosphoesterase [Vicinamibacterales bacterium]
MLGRPTDRSIALSVLANVGTEVYVEYSTASGVYTANSPVSALASSPTTTIELTGLQPNTRYFYRARYRLPSESAYRAEPERSFWTQRATGSTFSFGVQGDSHPERAGQMFNADLYALNMRNVASERPDFYMALGDDFSVEPLLDRGTWSAGTIGQLYATQRGWFGLVGHSSSVFLVNGNHEQAAQYLVNGRYNTPYAAVPALQAQARTTYFALPAPDTFYTGDAEQLPDVGPLRDYYAWTWGDALFVTIDPYWHSPVPVDNGVPGVDKISDAWQATMGDAQYQWLKRTLETSRAKYKFVFEHHVLGTGRGAAAIVHTFEWGGYNKNGTAYEFGSMRPTWAKPIHQLLNDTGVTIVFSAHDHLFAREKVDNVIYQSVPNPADNTYTAFNADAYVPSRVQLPGARYVASEGVTLPNAGHLLVTVTPQQVTVSYVRAVLPGDESKAGVQNGAAAFSYGVTSTPTLVSQASSLP